VIHDTILLAYFQTIGTYCN